MLNREVQFKGRPSLAGSPLEILVFIQYFLDPYDILSLRRTCKNVSSSTYELNVWRGALRNMCDEHGLFHPNFPIHRMTKKELEHATISPLWLSSKFQRDRNLRPLSTRILMYSWENSAGVLSHQTFHQCVLVPGGRYLISKSNTEIQLWDLGYSPGSAIKPFPIATMAFSGKFLDMEPSADGKGIRIILYSLSEVVPAITVYEVYPLSSAPQFDRIAIIGLDEEPMLTGVNEGVIAVRRDDAITVWDYVQDAGVSWAVPESERNSEALSAIIQRLCAQSHAASLADHDT